MGNHHTIQVEVIYALPEKSTTLKIFLPVGSTVFEVITASRIESIHPEIDWKVHRIGIYAKLVTFETVVEDQDRVEIYRPLLLSPQEARRLIAEQQKKKTLK